MIQSRFYDKLLAHHQLVNLLLLNGVHALRHNLWGYQVVNVVHRLWRQTLFLTVDTHEFCIPKSKNLLDSLAVPGLGLVPHLQGFIDASGSSRWDSSSEKWVREI